MQAERRHEHVYIIFQLCFIHISLTVVSHIGWTAGETQYTEASAAWSAEPC